MNDLFTTKPTPPLAELLRPSKVADVVGQAHLLGPGMPLRLAFDAGKLHSFILWGPPGVGKTTIGRLAASATNSEFTSLSAVLAGVKEIRAAADAAQEALNRTGRGTVLFIDEVHRFNKTQQDALLPHVESGLFLLISGTTHNPSFAIDGALLSRAQVYVMEPLTAVEMRQLYVRARPSIAPASLSDEALKLLCAYADGDGRRFLNLLEQVCVAANGAGIKEVSLEFAKSSTSPSLRRFDRGEDATYDTISAFQKSIRGSNPDAAIYWLARMLDGGADVSYIARRMIVIASEDIGNADPRALTLALSAADAYQRLGAPEGEFALAQAVLYLALAPKSNAAYTAWNEVRAQVRSEGTLPVPMHLRNAPTKLMKELGFKRGYRYAHDEPHGYAAGENYLPDGVAESGPWYRPVPRGMEVKLGEKLDWLRSLDAAASDGTP